MKSFSVAASLVSLAVSPALADFQVYIGMSSAITEGGVSQPWQMLLFNNQPDCNDVRDAAPYYASPHDDATINGYVCDGCDADEGIDEWDFERLEFDHETEFEGDAEGVVTMYHDDDGKYRLWDESGNSFGTCNYAVGGDTVTCDVMGGSEHEHVFECISPLNIPDSN